MPDNAIVNGISLYEEDWNDLDTEAERRGIGRSAMVRLMKREWQAAERLRLVGQAHALGMMTTEVALQYIIDIASDMPLAIHVIGDDDDGSA